MPYVYAALAVITLVTSIIQLFSSGDRSVADLLNIQTELLQNLSRQLAVIQRGMELILTRLEAIQELLGVLPKQVVDELSRRQLTGLLGTYNELISGYTAERTAHGIDRAQRRFKPYIEDDLLEPLRNTRSMLFTFNEALHIPLIASALQAELHGMVLAGYPSSQVVAALTRYETWLKDILQGDSEYSIPKRMEVVRKQRKEIFQEIASLHRQDTCLIRRWTEPNQAPELMPELPGDWIFAEIKAVRHGFTPQANPKIESSEALAIVRNSGIVTEEDFRQVVTPSEVIISTVRLRIVQWGASTSHPDIVAESQVRSAINSTRTCSTADAKEDLIPAAVEFASRLDLTSYSLFTLAACQIVGNEALEAIRKFMEDSTLRN